MMLRGQAWVFSGQVTTDDILPGRFLDRHGAELGQFAMHGIDPDFAGKVKPGDIVVAGENFGAGSGRESAPAALRYAGVGAVVCTSAARVFYRNGVNLGLPVVVVDSIEGIVSGDSMMVDIAGGKVRVPSRNLELTARNLSGIAFDILSAGGIVSYTMARKNGGAKPARAAAVKAGRRPERRVEPVQIPVDAKGPFGGRVGWGARPALLIVDFMRGYTEPAEPFYAPPVIPAVQATRPLLEVARARGIPIVFTKVVYSEHALEGGHFVRKIPALRKLVHGARAAEIVAELAPLPSEPILVKQYASAFYGTPLASLLTSCAVDTIILTGCSTSGCIRATAVDGMQHGWRVIVPRECVGDRTADRHESNLFDIDAKYGDVEPVLDVLRKLEKPS